MPKKRKSLKIILLVTAAILLIGALCWQSFQIRRLYKGVGRPSIESRELGDARLHSWMTPEEVAQRYGIPVSEVFKTLGIEAQPGDEKLPLQQLWEKYHKSREDVRRGLMQLHHRSEQPRPGP